MNFSNRDPAWTIRLFEPAPDVVYTIDMAARLAQVPRRIILLCCKHGLISPLVGPVDGGCYFDDEAVRTLRRIEFLRRTYGINFRGTRMILELLAEVEDLRDELRFLRQ
ncbi:MAG: MerR family transcriptional regulator [Verrucomicrobiales bacterium]|nr:MerR family transcriptional regulator [Verrucomicrobiales bacterium]